MLCLARAGTCTLSLLKRTAGLVHSCWKVAGSHVYSAASYHETLPLVLREVPSHLGTVMLGVSQLSSSFVWRGLSREPLQRDWRERHFLALGSGQAAKGRCCLSLTRFRDRWPASWEMERVGGLDRLGLYGRGYIYSQYASVVLALTDCSVEIRTQHSRGQLSSGSTPLDGTDQRL